MECILLRSAKAALWGRRSRTGRGMTVYQWGRTCPFGAGQLTLPPSNARFHGRLLTDLDSLTLVPVGYAYIWYTRRYECGAQGGQRTARSRVVAWLVGRQLSCPSRRS